MEVKILLRLTADQIEELKTISKSELSFAIRLTTNKEKYARGTINILPTKKSGRKFTESQVGEIIEFMERYGLYSKSFAVTDKNPASLWQGITYICKIES